MTNWSGFAASSGTRVTTWSYHANLGYMQSKRYPDANGTDYTQSPGGRLLTRTWARLNGSSARITTTYGYGLNNYASSKQHGALLSISYNDGTAGVTFDYDRRGRQTQTVRNGITTTRTFNDAGQPLGESYAGGTLAGLSVNATYDTLLRRATINFQNGATVLGSSTYGYDNASRLASVGDGTYSANYTYQGNSSLLNAVTFKQSTTTRLTTTRKYDFLNRLQSINSTPAGSGQPTVGHAYQYNVSGKPATCRRRRAGRRELGRLPRWARQLDAPDGGAATGGGAAGRQRPGSSSGSWSSVMVGSFRSTSSRYSCGLMPRRRQLMISE